jgi:hypothetical protein
MLRYCTQHRRNLKSLLQPWQLLLLVPAGWIYLREQELIEYLRAENRVLREKLGKRRILLNDDQRRRLAVKGKILGRETLEQVATIVTPDMILQWHLELVAAKWDYSRRREKSHHCALLNSGNHNARRQLAALPSPRASEPLLVRVGDHIRFDEMEGLTPFGLALGENNPPAPIRCPKSGGVGTNPVLGGLHYEYRLVKVAA